jgi:hypothetical protein
VLRHLLRTAAARRCVLCGNEAAWAAADALPHSRDGFCAKLHRR